jgi:hypothetical protein
MPPTALTGVRPEVGPAPAGSPDAGQGLGVDQAGQDSEERLLAGEHGAQGRVAVPAEFT